MRLDDRFGDFLLFRQLASTPLGSTHRAGRLQARAIDRVVLLHRFDGDGIDRSRLAADAEDRATVLDFLPAPQFANGLGLGTEDGIPYVAYDYLLGRTLEETLRRAEKKGRPPEASYLVALIEQAATALVAANRIRLGGLPIQHGFLVPELLLLSAEGRVYPLGFSHGPALLKQGPLVERFAAYLSPEARRGEEPRGDDVYSLAAILFAGLTGSPPDPEQPTATQVDQSLLGVAGAPLAPAVQDLLKNGLAPAASRPDLVSFHQSLRRIVEETEDSPSQFQLAFFLHQLFRDELEVEAVEMRGEKTTRFDPLALAAPETPPETPPEPQPQSHQPEDSDEAGDTFETLPIPVEPPSAAGARFAGRPFLSGVAVALVLAALTAGALQLTRWTPAATANSADTEASPELRRLVAESAAGLQRRLEDEYDPRLTRLRQDVLSAQSAKRERELSTRRALARQTANATSAVSPPGSAPPEPEASAELPAAEVAASSATPDLAGTPTEPPPTEEDGPSNEPIAVLDPQTRPGTQPLSAEAVAATTEVTPPPAAAPPPPVEATETEPAPPATDSPADEASLDEQARAFTPPRLLEPPQPRYPALAQRLGKTARVQVRVRVDAQGRVSDSEVLSGETRFGFDKAALQAAAKTRWTPARSGAESTSAWAVLTIDFRL